jgi:hypothetical protein
MMDTVCFVALSIIAINKCQLTHYSKNVIKFPASLPMNIAITAPIYVTTAQHKKYLDLTTKSITSANHEIVWLPCENFVHPAFAPLTYTFDHKPSKIKILYPTGQQSVSQAWNKGIEEGKRAGCNYILVINTDIIFKTNAIDLLVDFAEAHPEAVMWTMSECADLANLDRCVENEDISEHPLFSCFLVAADFFKYVGNFDENFAPAYFEDTDMHARLALAGLKAFRYGGARFFHFGSGTIKSDRELVKKNTSTLLQCQLYFLEKWGHQSVNDVERMREVYYKHPYNEKNKPLSYWRHDKNLGLYGRFKCTLPLSVKYPLIIALNIKNTADIVPNLKQSVRYPAILVLNWISNKLGFA